MMKELDEKYNNEQFDMEHHELLIMHDANAYRIARLEKENKQLAAENLNLHNQMDLIVQAFNTVMAKFCPEEPPIEDIINKE
jgi:spore coat polysaccharide biosynthesis protein SpsF (cytidylyltransferase family)